MGCLGIKMPKLRYERDRSSPSPTSHDKEIRLVLIVAERGAEHTKYASPCQSFSTSGKVIFLPELPGSFELCCVLWDSITSFGKAQREIPSTKHH